MSRNSPTGEQNRTGDPESIEMKPGLGEGEEHLTLICGGTEGSILPLPCLLVRETSGSPDVERDG